MSNDQVAIDELAKEGQPLVISLATKIARTVPVRVDLNDLIAYGEVGLLEAAREFDPERKNQFSTFAYYRIRGAIYDGLSKMTWMSRSRYRRLRFKTLADEMLAKQKYPDTNSSADLKTEAGWMGEMSEKLAVVFLSSNDGDLTEAALVDAEESAPNSVAQQEENENLHRAVQTLPAQQRRLITMVYFEGFNLREASERLGLSKSWASRLHAKALEEIGRLIK